MSEPFEITPQEDRFLRAFFRRQALPYMAGFALVAIGACYLVLTLGGRGETASSPPAAASAAAAAALEALRAGHQQLRADLAELEHAIETRAVEERIAGAKQRLETLESRLASALRKAAQARPSAPPADASTSGGASVVERLYNLEVSRGREKAERATFEKDVLNRLYRIEASRDERERAWLASEQTVLRRLDQLERRAHNLERQVAARPAAAAPEASRP